MSYFAWGWLDSILFQKCINKDTFYLMMILTIVIFNEFQQLSLLKYKKLNFTEKCKFSENWVSIENFIRNFTCRRRTICSLNVYTLKLGEIHCKSGSSCKIFTINSCKTKKQSLYYHHILENTCDSLAHTVLL